MKIVVIGGSGLIGSRLSNILRLRGHEVVAASQASGVDLMSGQGLDAALEGAQVVVDVSNAPYTSDEAVMEFFRTAGHNLLAAEERAGVAHHVLLSIIGTNRLQDSGYFRAKQAQEDLVIGTNRPYSIVQATQFMEFLEAIAQSCVVGNEIHVPAADMQPMAAQDVATLLADAALGKLSGFLEVAGPERMSMASAIQQVLRHKGDTRPVKPDPQARYFGMPLEVDTLVPTLPPASDRRRCKRGFRVRRHDERASRQQECRRLV
ncbi:SDR family oxidoreductase [Variovorax sp. UC122_21]|uniref:SDR family oxidoreductase n=1 Tax=Variovorax sp. UC122_21 TaxID=3374554 RepID=UPI0037568901